MSFGAQFPVVLDAARVGAEWAFDRLYRELAPGVVGYLRLQGAEDPEDLSSEVFLGAFRGLERFVGDEEAFRSWIFSIAHARLIDDRRRSARRIRTATSEGMDWAHPGGTGVEDQAMGHLGEEEIRALCARLAPDQADVLLLRLVGDLSLEQVATALNKSTGAVKSLQRRGVDALRRELAKQNAPGAVSR